MGVVPAFPTVLVISFLLSSSTSLVYARQISGEDQSVQLARALAAQHAGDLAQAEQICLVILRTNPKSVEARYELGLSYYMEHNWRDSSSHLLQVNKVQPDSFPALLLLGMDFLKLNEPKQAIVYLERARGLRPDDEYANHNLANAEYMTGDYPKAATDYIHYLGREPHSTDVIGWYGLGEVTLVLARRSSSHLAHLQSSDPYRLLFLAKTYEQEQNWNAALKQLSALSENPTFSLSAQLEIGEVKIEMGQSAEAVAIFLKLLQEHPEYIEAHFDAGKAFLLQHDVIHAVEQFVLARSNPWFFSDPEALSRQLKHLHVNLQANTVNIRSGISLVDLFVRQLTNDVTQTEQVDFAATLRQYCQAKEADNRRKYSKALMASSVQFRTMAASDLLDEGDLATAADLLGRIASHESSEKRKIALLKARLAIRAKDILEATSLLLPVIDNDSAYTSFWAGIVLHQVSEGALNTVLSISPDSVYAHLLRAQSEDAEHQTDDAVKEFQRAVLAAPDNPLTYLKLGDLLWQVGRYQEAISALQEGLKLDPDNAAAYYQIGDSLVRLSDDTGAQRFLKEALERDSSLLGASTDLGKIYRDEGKISESVVILAKVADRDVDGSINYLLFRNYSALGDKQTASRYLRRYRELAASRRKVAQSDAQNAGGQINGDTAVPIQ